MESANDARLCETDVIRDSVMMRDCETVNDASLRDCETVNDARLRDCE